MATDGIFLRNIPAKCECETGCWVGRGVAAVLQGVGKIGYTGHKGMGLVLGI